MNRRAAGRTSETDRVVNLIGEYRRRGNNYGDHQRQNEQGFGAAAVERERCRQERYADQLTIPGKRQQRRACHRLSSQLAVFGKPSRILDVLGDDDVTLGH